TEHGLSVTELDSVPGGIGLTAWLNEVYTEVDRSFPGGGPGAVGDGNSRLADSASGAVLGGADGMMRGFASIFGNASQVHIVVSEEAATYRPEMMWLADKLDGARFKTRDTKFEDFQEGDAVYRFFELFDLENVPNSRRIFEMANAGRIRLTPPP